MKELTVYDCRIGLKVKHPEKPERGLGIILDVIPSDLLKIRDMHKTLIIETTRFPGVIQAGKSFFAHIKYEDGKTKTTFVRVGSLTKADTSVFNPDQKSSIRDAIRKLKNIGNDTAND